MADAQDIVTVRLSFSELHLAAMVGVNRQCVAMKKRLRDKHTREPLDSPWEKHIVGAQGEAASASYLGLYWAGTVGRLDARDLPTGLEVKTRLHTPGVREKWKLDLILPIDTRLEDETRIILVYGRGADFDLVGWTTTTRAKADAIIDTKRGRENYYIKPIQLSPMAELKEIVDGARGLAASLEEGGDQPGLCSEPRGPME